jgi:hypothetical protein
MKDVHQLMNEITQLTSNMETNYPEIYQYLDENPITVASEGSPEIDIKLLTEYLDCLKGILKNHIETHHLKDSGRE